MGAAGDDKAASAQSGEVRLSFADTSWVEIRDGRGRVLQSQTNPAGSTHVVTGDPPFSLVIGNASRVKVAFNGKPVDLAPFIRANIARLINGTESRIGSKG